ncbi:MAG: hypothetical protein CMJ31_01010 [Phycisphaerae bacterium]|nr:hypothetical protein [Phycisphaerae bacterium]
MKPVARVALPFAATVATALGLAACSSQSAREPTTVNLATTPKPLRFDRLGLFFVIEAHTESGPLRLLVDTGAARTFLDDDVARQFPRKNLRSTRDRVRSANGEIVRLSSYLEVKSLTVGAFEATDLRAPLLDLAQIQRVLGDDIDGLLGWDVLRSAVTTFDFADRTIRIDPPSASPARDVNAGARLVPGDIAITVIELAGQRTRAVVDTGSDGPFAVASVEQLPLNGPVRDGALVRGVGGAHRSREATLKGVAKFGGATFTNPIVGETAGLPRVGSAALAGGVLVIDGPRGVVWFEPGKGSNRDRD